MTADFSYENVLNAPYRAAWQIDDVIGPGQMPDFTRPFMPEALARTEQMEGLSPRERLILNQIRGHEYLNIFGLVEEFILPFVLDHVRPALSQDDHRTRALLQFASEEAKHIHLFKRFHAAFQQGFGTDCAVIGPAETIAAEVLRHDPLAVAITVLHFEWMTQSHYVDSVHDHGELDALFRSLLRHHWIEEAQHARLDILMVEALAEGRSPGEIDAAIDGYLEIGMFFNSQLKTQTEFNLDAFERATGRILEDEARLAFLAQQSRAACWTYIGSGMTHAKFRETLDALSSTAHEKIDTILAACC